MSHNMPSVGHGRGQGQAMQYVNNPTQSLHSQLKGSPSHSQQVASKVHQGGGDQITRLVSRSQLQDLVRDVDPTVQLDEDVEDMLLKMADDFIDNTLDAACSLAIHRNSPRVELRDIQLHLERKWNMWIPGFGNDEIKPFKRAAVTEAHKQRMALIKKTIKKS